MAKQQKDPLDEIAAELVVFKHEDVNHPERYFSNDPRFQDSRIRDRWMELYSDESIADSEGEDEVEEIDDDPGYGEWKNDDLRAELVKRGLSVDGTKAEMADRLYEDDDKQEG